METDTQTHRHTHTDTQTQYSNPRCACAPRVNDRYTTHSTKVTSYDGSKQNTYYTIPKAGSLIPAREFYGNTYILEECMTL